MCTHNKPPYSAKNFTAVTYRQLWTDRLPPRHRSHHDTTVSFVANFSIPPTKLPKTKILTIVIRPSSSYLPSTMNTKTLMCMARADSIRVMSRKSPTSPFGHETLDPSDKQNRVQDIFSSVSRNYDNTKPIISNNLRAYFHCKKHLLGWQRLYFW